MLWAFFALILWHLVSKHQLNSHLKVFSYIYNHLPLNVVSAAELPVNKKAAAVFSEACQLNKNANLNVFSALLCGSHHPHFVIFMQMFLFPFFRLWHKKYGVTFF